MHKTLHVSSKGILAKIERDFKPGSSTWIGDALEWIGEAMGHIGCYGQYGICEIEKGVADHKVAFPCSIDNFIAIKYQGLRMNLNPRLTNTAQINRIQGEPHPTQFFNYNAKYVTTTFQTGKVTFVYHGIPMSEGWPMIPNNESYREAVSFYIVMKMIQGGFLHPIFAWKDAHDWFEHYAQRARNEVDEMTIVDMDTFLEEYTSVFCGVDALNRMFGQGSYNGLISGSATDNPFVLNP